LIGAHRQIALDDDRHHPAVFGHEGHVQGHVPLANRSVAEEFLQDARDLLVRDLGVFRPSSGGCQKPLGARHQQAGGRAD
jgi:hypothetical protein